MSITRCACPNCRAAFRVPDNMVGKTTRCQKCGELLVIRAMGGKTTLELAGVGGDAPTASLPAEKARSVQQATHRQVDPEQIPSRSPWNLERRYWVPATLVVAAGMGACVLLLYWLLGRDESSAKAKRLYQQALAARQYAPDTEVKALLDAAVADSPNYAPAYALRAKMVLELGPRNAQTLRPVWADVKKCCQLDPDNPEYQQMYYECRAFVENWAPELLQQP